LALGRTGLFLLTHKSRVQ